MKREHPHETRRRPVVFLTVVLALTWAVLAWLGWSAYSSHRQRSVEAQRHLDTDRLHGTIIHLREVLHMSARMAAATGDLRWVDRYRQSEPMLDSAIKQAMEVAPHALAREAAASTDAANVQLVATEKHAFDLIRQGHADQARNILFGGDYEKQMQVCAREMTRFEEYTERRQPLEEMRATIIHLDEVLTMSARLAAATGDLRWEDRYRQCEPLLDAVIKDTMKLAPDVYGGKGAAETDAANVRLVEMENRAFHLVRQGRADDARRILFGDEYEAQKRVYAQGMEKLSARLANIVSNDVEQERRRTLRQSIGVLLAGLLLLIGWFVAYRTLRAWQANLAWNNRQLTAQAEELAQLNRSLDQKVEDRTAELTAANKELEGQIDERIQVEEKLQEHAHDLGERVKELNCLHGLSKILEEPNVSVEEIIHKTLALIPPAWQYPEITCARIVLDGKTDETDNFTETLWKQSAALFVHDEYSGALEICYLEEKLDEDEGPFLKEERALIDAITECLGKAIQRINAEAEVRSLKQQIEFALGATKTGLYVIDMDYNLRYVDPQWQGVYGNFTGRKCYEYYAAQTEPCARCTLATALQSQNVVVSEATLPKENSRPIQVTGIPFQNAEKEWLFAAVNVDISERKLIERELAQAQKLEAIGQLAAGIAHEINTPSQYIGDNIRFLQDAFGDIDKLLGTFNRLLEAAKDHTLSEELIAEVDTAVREADVDYLTDETPKAIRQSLEGVDKVAHIVRAMKEFSHPGSDEKQAVDLNRTIENTLTVSRNEWKYVADLVTDFEANLPLVPCFPSEFNQVILNVVVNAAQAISDVVGDGSQGMGTITVSTRRDGDWVEIRIQDTGTGIPQQIRSKVFDHFFTTKEVGKGTGQGLTIAHSIITEKHAGTITFESESGRGTTFIVRLPITEDPAPEQLAPSEEAQAAC